MSDVPNGMKSSQRQQIFPEPTVGPIIYNDQGEILLIRSPKWGKMWHIPGGHIELGETSEEALKREILEETNLEIDKIEFIGWQDAVYPEFFHVKRHFLFLDFCAHLAGGEIKASDEMTEWIWIEPNKALAELNIDPFTFKTIGFYLEHLGKKNDSDYEQKWKRALADYDNLKKETIREKTEMAQFARSMVAFDFTTIFDNFKKAAAHLPEAGDNLADYKKKVEQWAKGIEFIQKQFGETLKQMGLEEIKTVGEKFNPACHEAVGEEIADGTAPGIIIKEIDSGYKMGDRVIKAAKVIVNK